MAGRPAEAVEAYAVSARLTTSLLEQRYLNARSGPLSTPGPAVLATMPGRRPYHRSVKRILLTGMSGVGKSTVISRLAALGHHAVDLDHPDWSAWVDSPDGQGPSPMHPGKDWVWREDRVCSLLATEGDDLLFVSGCSPNQGQFHEQFDAIVLLSAPAEVMVERLTRRGGDYGKHPEEVVRSLELKETVEPMLRAAADLEIDTSAPLDEVVEAVLELASS